MKGKKRKETKQKTYNKKRQLQMKIQTNSACTIQNQLNLVQLFAYLQAESSLKRKKILPSSILMARGKTTNQVTCTKDYAIRNKKDVKIFIPNVTKLFGLNRPAKTKLIKKHPKDKPLKEKKGIKKEVKVKSPTVEKKKQKTRKTRTLIHQRTKKAKEQTKKTLSSTTKKHQKSLSKATSSLKAARASLRLKKLKKVQNLHEDNVLQATKLRSKKQNIQKNQSRKAISAKKPKQDKNKTTKSFLERTKQPLNKYSTKSRPKSSSKSKKNNLSSNTKVMPPKRIRKNLNNLNPNTPELRSQEESIMSKVSELSRSKQIIQLRMRTIAELQRINRSRQQRIFLLNAQRVENEGWTFKVIGTKGKTYETKLSTNAVCSCLDFRSKRKPCKHIYFIVTQIAQNEKILEGFTSKGTITEAAYDELNQSLCRRLKARISGEKQEQIKIQIDLKDDKDCVICFTEMNQSQQTLQDCKTCKKYFHYICIKKWKTHNNSCPLCRSEFAASKEERDPLQKFEELKI